MSNGTDDIRIDSAQPLITPWVLAEELPLAAESARAIAGYRADIAWSEEYGIGIAILMNVEGGNISELTTTFWRMAFERVPATGDKASLAGASR